MKFLENNEWEVLTDEGFKDFKGLSVSTSDDVITLVLENEIINCTKEHNLFLDNGDKIAAKDCLGKFLKTKRGLSKVIKIKEHTPSIVYDLIHVSKTNKFYANDILISNCCMIDECSFIPQHIWDDFYMSVYPTISSGKSSKMLVVSTPNGMNHFYDMYRAAVKGESNFRPIKVAWNERPDRDEQWAEDMKRDVGAKRFAQEFQCKFLGASNTLVDGDVLEKIDTKIPIDQKYSFAMPIYEKPIEGAFYIMGVDSAKGNEADYSVIQVLKVKGKYDLEQVAMYRSNTTNIDAFVQICIGISEYYNDAYMMVENNDVGALVAEKLWYDWECDRIINVDKKGLGIRATKKTKFEGNMLLQRYVEEGWLKINDERTVYELSRYEETSPNVYHAAGQNENDDCVTAILWALYFVITPFYDSEESGVMVKKRKENIDDEMPTFLSDGDDHNDWSFLHNMK